jgi:CRISPR-associated endonuclease Cas2
MKSDTYYILMYDITSEKILQKVARNLEQHGYIRLNYSVWFGWNDPAKNPILKKKLLGLLEDPLAKGSRLYFLPVNEKDFRMIRRHNGKKIDELDYWMGDRATQFF